MKQKILLITVGTPGSGKSTWCQSYIRNHPNLNIHYVSRDEIRFSLLRKDELYFSHEDEVVALFNGNIIKGLKNPEVDVVIADATHLSDKARRRLLNAIPLKNVIIVPVYFNVPVGVCIQRNNMREGNARVPEDKLYQMFGALSWPLQDKRYGRKYECVWVVDQHGNKMEVYE